MAKSAGATDGTHGELFRRMRNILFLAAIGFSWSAPAAEAIVADDPASIAPGADDTMSASRPSKKHAPVAWDVGTLARKSEIVAVGSIEAIGLDPTSRHPRIIGLFRVEEAVRGVRAGESFTVVWTAPLASRAYVPETGNRIVLFGDVGMDGFVRPTGNGTGVYRVVHGDRGDAAYRDLRDFRVQTSRVASRAGGEELLPLDRFVEALRDAR